MKEITIDTITNNDEYTVPKTEKNMNALLNADYTKPTLIVLDDEDNDTVCILSTEVQGFYTEGFDDDAEDDYKYDYKDDYDTKSCDTKNGLFSRLVRIVKREFQYQ